jgi:hypothetical protein
MIGGEAVVESKRMLCWRSVSCVAVAGSAEVVYQRGFTTQI